MYTSRQKKRDNIAEYVLYMYQVEDLIRANDCEIEKIRTHIVSGYDVPKEQKAELTEWWDNLAEMMKLENLEKSGHLQMLANTVNELNTLHSYLLKSPENLNYQMQFQSIVPLLKELENKTHPQPSNDIELMFSAIYNSFMLKLKGEKITEATQAAIQSFARFLSLLSEKYRKEQSGTLNEQ